MNYNNFKTKCEALGKKYEVFVDAKYNDMSAWGLQDWFCASFEVDRFGGIAAIISFYEGNLWYESAEFGKRIFTSWEEMEEWLAYDIKQEAAARENVEMFNCD